MRLRLAIVLGLGIGLASPSPAADSRAYPLPRGAGVHDVAPSPEANGPVWYTAQRQGALGKLDPVTGKVEQIRLGAESAPHGVIIGPDGAPWVTDSGLNAVVRVDPKTHEVTRYPLPEGGYANLNTASFDRDGRIWFTGQNGIYGRLDPANPGDMKVWKAPRGRGPYGITTTPSGEVYYASLAGNHIARIDPATGEAQVIEPPTPKQGARRVWSDSKGRVWVSEWNSGQVAVYDPAAKSWKSWKLPGERPRAYAVYVDARDKVWLSDWGANAIVRFDPETERFDAFPNERANADVRQLLGRRDELWIPESGTDTLVLRRTGP